jgi:Raf kinase inhibitor-like YbhB/YbcL family protein
MKIKNLSTTITCFLIMSGAQATTIPPVSSQLKDPRAADVTVVGHILEPKQKELKKHLAKIALPEGFEVSIFAKDLINPRMIAVAPNGAVYVTRREVGDVIKLVDTNQDGVADEQEVVANRPGMHGIAIDGDNVYLATVNDLYKTTIQADGSFAPLEHFVDDLPDGGQHPNRTLAIGPDGKLYVSVGSTCNACDETNPESATMLQMNTDGTARKIFASGLRNTIGFAFEPDTGELYGMDHGIDWLGDNEQYEELNHLVQGKQYGWPYIYDNGKFNPQDEPPGNISLKEWASRSINPIGFYTPHAAPMQMTFYTGTQFPEEFRGDAFIAMRGSWNRKPPAGYEVARIRFEGGKPKKIETFVQGFLSEKGNKWIHYGRLAGLAQTTDGALLLADDANGIIYRIAYTGSNKHKKRLGPPTNSFNVHVRVVSRDLAVPDGPHVNNLMFQLLSANHQLSLTLSSPAFKDGAFIPTKYALEGENISPSLNWSKGPDGTKSYAIFIEDPDVHQNPPFVHWSIFNIAPDVLSLPEGVPTLPELAKPKDALQGKNDRGSIGYIGPNPPATDSSHRYYFQVFALDKKLKLPVGATRAELLTAMQGHVLSNGYILGLYDR